MSKFNSATLPRLRALQVARRCLALRARLQTIEQVSGLGRRDILAQFGNVPSVSGRYPKSPDYWYFNSCLTVRAEASMFLAQYRHILKLGFSPQEALLTAYERYAEAMPHAPAVSIDRALNLVGHLDALWGVPQATIDLACCPTCGAWSLVCLGPAASATPCVFCRLTSRYASDRSIRVRFPDPGLPNCDTGSARLVSPRRIDSG